MKLKTLTFLTAALAALSLNANAAEYYIGEPVVKNNMQIVPNYLVGITMEPMPKGMDMAPDAIHLEVDVHATKGETHGFAEDAWIPYLNVIYTIEQVGGTFKQTGILAPMVAADGPHYANNVKLPANGKYHLTYHFEPPSINGFAHHTDKATGTPDWWKPFDADWTFNYPSKAK